MTAVFPVALAYLILAIVLPAPDAKPKDDDRIIIIRDR